MLVQRHAVHLKEVHLHKYDLNGPLLRTIRLREDATNKEVNFSTTSMLHVVLV